ncbi:putative MATE family efflux protein [Clostridiales Family XIII bacterium PM5-7]
MPRLSGDKQFYRKMVIIGIPVVFQNLISIGLNLIDTLMIGMLGEQQLAAVGAANQVYFIFTVSLFGLFSGAAVYTAQYWGAQDLDGVRKVLGIDYLVGLSFAVVVSILAYALAPQIIGLFSEDDAVIQYGVNYIRIACFSYIFSSISGAISYNSRAIQNLMVPTIINAVALSINAVLNYLLIFGKAGLPQMGVEGAAVATLIARVFEFLALVGYVYTRKEHPLKVRPDKLLQFGKELFKKVMKTAMPVVLTEGGWSLSVALIFAAYGMLGTSALAVAQVANVVSEMLQSVYFGVGNASAMLIGEMLGQKNKEKAFQSGKQAVRIVWILNAIITVVMILISVPVSGIYNFSGETNRLLIITLITMAVLLTPKMLGYIYIVGILRAGGDTVFCMKVETICNLCVQAPLAYIAVLLFHLPLPLAMAMVQLGDLVRIFVCRRRFNSKKWINIVT